MKNLIDTKVKSDTTKGYLYINEVCKTLYSDVFKKKVEENHNKLGFRVDEDFSLVLIHEFFWEYSEFNSYQKTELEEAKGDKKKSEDELTQSHLKELGSFI